MDRIALGPSTFRAVSDARPVDWVSSSGQVDYTEAVAAMERRAEAIAAGRASECVWLVEHPPIYTAGTSAQDRDLAATPRFPVYRTGRGGQYTYHGPGQRVAYVMLDLRRRTPDVRAYVAALEAWIIATLAQFAIVGERREDRVGVWVRRRDKAAHQDGSIAEDKIAAIGIRVRRWVSFHGIAINVDPDLSHFADIVPCGIAAAHLGVTSLADLDRRVSLRVFDTVLRTQFEAIFGQTLEQPVSDAERRSTVEGGGEPRSDLHAFSPLG